MRVSNLALLFALSSPFAACGEAEDMSVAGPLVELSEPELFEVVRDTLCDEVISRCTEDYTAEECRNDLDDDSAYQEPITREVRLGLEACLDVLVDASCELVNMEGPEGFSECAGLAPFLNLK